VFADQDRGRSKLLIDWGSITEEKEVGIEVRQQFNRGVPIEEVAEEGRAAGPVVLDRPAGRLDPEQGRIGLLQLGQR